MAGVHRRGALRISFVGLLCVGMSSSAWADEAAEGVHLQVEASRRVSNDRMQAVLAVELQDEDAARVSNEVNRAMAWALERARRAEGIVVESGAYQTRPVWDKQKIRRWHASQELHLEAKDTDRLSVLIGELQSRLQLKNVSFTVSPEERRRVENELISEALDAFKVRAEIVRVNLGAPSYRIAELHIDQGGAPIPVRLHRNTMSGAGEAVATPVFEAGTSHVTVHARGRIVLGK